VPQIVENAKSGSTGQLAFITVTLNFFGNVARIFTTLTEVPDPVLLWGVFSSAALNGTLFAQVRFVVLPHDTAS
jgi:mannose-P-dolichol utilization defect protein 1